MSSHFQHPAYQQQQQPQQQPHQQPQQLHQQATRPQRWGRVLISGGTDWEKLGRKDRNAAAKEEDEEVDDPQPDLLGPHILRSLSNVCVVSIHTSAFACHCIAIDVHGAAWLFGRNTTSALGVERAYAISENAPKRIFPAELGATQGTRFVNAATGRGHTLLVGSDGNVWTAGANTLGQCGHPACPEITNWKAVAVAHEGQREHVVAASAGVTFSLFLTHSGKIFAAGSGENGQLGNGRTGEHIATGNKSAYDVHSAPVLVRGLEGKRILQISCGQQHSVALDSDGLVYVWGYGGYCRLGLGNQANQLVPTAVPTFASDPAMKGMIVSAGPSSTAVVDRTGMYWLAGKWKNSGEGSGGSPYSSFRYLPDIMGCKVSLARSGGVTHWVLTPSDEGGIMTVGWGQNAANGELALGEEGGKSATKPEQIMPLAGIDVFDIAAGQNTTLFLARPNDKLSDLPRHPAEVEAPPACLLCKEDTEEEDTALECEKCDAPYHLRCLHNVRALEGRKLNANGIPEGEWFCGQCQSNPGAPIGRQLPEWQPKQKSAPRGRNTPGGAGTPRSGGPAKRQVIEYDDDEPDEPDSGDEYNANGDSDDEAYGSRKKPAGGPQAKRRRT